MLVLFLLACGPEVFDVGRGTEVLRSAGYIVEADGDECVRVDEFNRACFHVYADIESAVHAVEFGRPARLQFVRGPVHVTVSGPDEEALSACLRQRTTNCMPR